MKLLFLKAGRFAHDESPQWAETYFKRLKRSHNIDFRLLKDGTLTKTLTELRARPETRLVLLDERGKAAPTKALAQLLGGWRNDGTVKEVAFVVGGSFGFSDEERKLAHSLVSLGPLTLAGDIAWIVLVEQIYRAVMIIEGHPYHHE